jgi:uncharacterized protein (TIGR02145 family)
MNLVINEKNPMKTSRDFKSKTDGPKLFAFLILSILLAQACQKEDPIFNPDIQYGSLSDGDNNVYRTVKIGTQDWMAENLKTTRYNDGQAIIHREKSDDWSGQEGSYCWYDNNSRAYKSLYGALYNWTAVNTGKLCPTGWHVPDIDEWKTLENYLITSGFNFDGTTTENRLASSLAATTKWEASTEPGSPGHTSTVNNRSGFSALPAGMRDPTHGWDTFKGIGSSCGWWTATEMGSFALHCSLDNHYSYLHLDDPQQLSSTLWSYGFSVRCVKD